MNIQLQAGDVVEVFNPKETLEKKNKPFNLIWCDFLKKHNCIFTIHKITGDNFTTTLFTVNGHIGMELDCIKRLVSRPMSKQDEILWLKS